MKRLLSGLALIVLAVPLFAQNRTAFSGVRVALDYAYGVMPNVGPLRVDVGNTTTGAGSTVTLAFGNIALGDGTTIMPLATTAPITIGIGANAETVTPTAVSCGTPAIYSTCVVTATLSNTHGIGDIITSGTVGLQEAINAAHGSGGIVAITGGWYTSGGTSTILNAALTYTNVGVVQHNLGSPTIGAQALYGSCTGTATASATLGLLGLGTEAIGTCTSTVVSAGQVMNHTGTIRSLLVNASAGGVGGGSGVFTVLKNGSATTSTCTLGTALTCTDVTHVPTFVAGDIIGVQFTTAGSETIANVKATVLAY